MATYNVNRAKHATLSAATVDTVNLAYSGSVLRVRNRSTTDPFYFTIDGTEPTVAGDETYFVGASENVTLEAVIVSTVKLISSGTPDYTVEKY